MENGISLTKATWVGVGIGMLIPLMNGNFYPIESTETVVANVSTFLVTGLFGGVFCGRLQRWPARSSSTSPKILNCWPHSVR